MRSISLAIVLMIILLSPALDAAAASSIEAPNAATASSGFLALKRALLTADDENVTAAVRDVEDRVLNVSAVAADDARAAWQAAASGEGPARERALAAEVALLDVAASNVRAALADDDVARARAWLAVILTRVPWELRDLPVPGDDATAEDVREALDAALALRAREELQQGVLLTRANATGDAGASIEGALALGRLLVPEATERLRPGLRNAFEQNLTAEGVAAAVAGAAEDPKGYALTPLAAALNALEYGRDVEPLDEVALRVADSLSVAVRAAREDPVLRSTLLDHGYAQYATDRAGLFLKGEGTIDDLDTAYMQFMDVAADAGADSVAATAVLVFDEVRELGLLERGIVLKVETGGVQPDRVHRYRVTLVRPPLDGVARYDVSLAFDPAVVTVVNVTPVAHHEQFAFRVGDGSVTFGGNASTPLRQGAHLAHLTLEAVGAPGTTSGLDVTAATFLEPDGDPAAILRLRNGSATVTERGDPPTVDDHGPERGTPLAAALVVVAAGVAAVRPRRR